MLAGTFVTGVPALPPAKTGFDEDGDSLFIGGPEKFSGFANREALPYSDDSNELELFL